MNQDLSMVARGDANAFVDMMGAMEAQSMPARNSPLEISLDGNNGTYSIRKFNPNTKKWDDEPFGESPYSAWNGTVLYVRWYIRWKYAENSKIDVFSDEFRSWKDPIRIFKTDWNKPKESRTIVYDNLEDYSALKAKYSQVDPVTEKSKSLFDLCASLYVYVPTHDAVMNFKMKGSTRSNLFDYLGAYKAIDGVEDVPRAMVEVDTLFGVEKKLMPAKEGKPEKFFFSGTFRSVRKLTEKELPKIQEMFLRLAQWLKSTDSPQASPRTISSDHDAPEDVEPVVVGENAPSSVEEGIRLEDIPF